MLELFRSLGMRGLAVQEVLPLGLALVTAELFYKFHSFTLEVVAFFATWFVVEALWAALLKTVGWSAPISRRP
jgi:hypothetical protein